VDGSQGRKGACSSRLRQTRWPSITGTKGCTGAVHGERSSRSTLRNDTRSHYGRSARHRGPWALMSRRQLRPASRGHQEPARDEAVRDVTSQPAQQVACRSAAKPHTKTVRDSYGCNGTGTAGARDFKKKSSCKWQADHGWTMDQVLKCRLQRGVFSDAFSDRPGRKRRESTIAVKPNGLWRIRYYGEATRNLVHRLARGIGAAH
jgi:hypothetical protein